MTKSIRIGDVALGEGIPKICIPLTGKNIRELCSQAERAKESRADLVEWRFDLAEDLLQENEKTEDNISAGLGELRKVLEEIPILFTIRTVKEGGKFSLSDELYDQYNLAAAETGVASLVDVEALQTPDRKKELIQKIHENHVLVIASSHDFAKTDEKEQLVQRFASLEESGADILKIAVMPHSFADVAALMQATDEARRMVTQCPLISMSMGSEGIISRIAGENFGSCLTFGTAGDASAPGQVEALALRQMMEKLHGQNQ